MAKYGRIVVEGKDIPAEEPLFLLRGQDKLAAQTVRHYARLRAKAGDKAGATECRAVAKAMQAWPKKKMPD